MQPKQIVFFLEERSAEEMLRGIMPRLLAAHPDIGAVYIAFNGCHALEKNLSSRIRGYQNPNAAFIILRDQDVGLCKERKQKLQSLVPADNRILIRIACRELESFYFGDLPAVEQGLNLNLERHAKKKHYRAPDQIQKPSTQLESLTQGKYAKIAGSRAIAPRLRLDGGNASPSFNALINGIRHQIQRLTQTPPL